MRERAEMWDGSTAGNKERGGDQFIKFKGALISCTYGKFLHKKTNRATSLDVGHEICNYLVLPEAGRIDFRGPGRNRMAKSGRFKFGRVLARSMFCFAVSMAEIAVKQKQAMYTAIWKKCC